MLTEAFAQETKGEIFIDSSASEQLNFEETG